LSCRRFGNLVLEWLLQTLDPEVWDKEYKDIFFGDQDKRKRQKESKARLAPAEKGKQGGLNLKKVTPKPVTDVAALIGKYGKNIADPARTAPIIIAPGSDGNLGITGTETPEG